MKWRRIVRAGAWLLLFGVAFVQVAAALVDERYIPLKGDEYQIRYANADELGVERTKEMQVLVRNDLLTPIPLLWTGSVSLIALLVLAAAVGQGKLSDAPCKQGR
jgi:hypothetical protein